MAGETIISHDFSGLADGAPWPVGRYEWRGTTEVTRDVQAQKGRTSAAAGLAYPGGYHTLLDTSVLLDPVDVTVTAPNTATFRGDIAGVDSFRWEILHPNGRHEDILELGAETRTFTTSPRDVNRDNGKLYRLRGWHSANPALKRWTRWATLTVVAATAISTPDLVNGDINLMPLGSVSQGSLEAAFGSLFWTNNLSRLEVRADANGDRYLRQTYPAGVVGGGAAFARRLAGLEEIWHSYQVWFEAGWQWVKGGKLGPGVGGGTYPSGGTYDPHGFTSRDMWRDKSGKHTQIPRIEQYLYYEEMTQTYGEEVNLGSPAAYPPVGEWVTIAHRVKLNTGLNADAIIDTWINGAACTRWTGRLRKSGTFKIDQYRHHSFYGGATSTWAPTQTTYARYRRYKASTTSAGVDGVTGG